MGAEETRSKLSLWDHMSVNHSKAQIFVLAYTPAVPASPKVCETEGGKKTPHFFPDHHLPEFTQTNILRVSYAIQPSHPLSSPFHLPPIPPSIRIFSNESTL